MRKAPFLLLTLFIAAFATDAIVGNSGNSIVRYFTKGALMLLLLAFFIVEVKQHASKINVSLIRLICLALVFSFAGDLLLINDSTAIHFIAGLASFLTAQIFYVAFFSRCYAFSKNNAAFIFISAIVIIIYLWLLNYLFLPKTSVQQLTIPVVVYSIVIGAMLFTSVNLIHSQRLRSAAIKYFIPGAVSFVASDSMLGFNRFYMEKPMPAFYIMFSYCLAQFLIVLGSVKIIKQHAAK
jgi:uncharacterized membrane protein YhhN